MTTELEQEFFRVFGIEPEINYVCDKRPCKKGLLKTCADIGCSHLYDTREDYPDITVEKLLEMICILSQSYPLNYEGWSFYTVQDLKETILGDCITTAKRLSLSSVFANKIQQLFNDNDTHKSTMLEIITDEEEY